jgi:hypothetical protein
MLPTNEIDTLTMTVTDAVDLAAEGKVADGYACLVWAAQVRAAHATNTCAPKGIRLDGRESETGKRRNTFTGGSEMRRIVLVVAACVAAVMAAPGTPSSAAGRELQGTVGPGFTISLRDEDGQPVTSLRPGTYWLTIDDLSSTQHNFHIFGPGLDVGTTVPFTGTVTVKIHLSHGEYTFQCDPHAHTMHGSFDVGGVGQGG